MGSTSAAWSAGPAAVFDFIDDLLFCDKAHSCELLRTSRPYVYLRTAVTSKRSLGKFYCILLWQLGYPTVYMRHTGPAFTSMSISVYHGCCAALSYPV